MESIFSGGTLSYYPIYSNEEPGTINKMTTKELEKIKRIPFKINREDWDREYMKKQAIGRMKKRYKKNTHKSGSYHIDILQSKE